MEGTFQHVSPQIEATEDFSQKSSEEKHAFFLATLVIPVQSDLTFARGPVLLREASSHSRKQSSISTLRGVRSSANENLPRFPFSFDIPLPSQPGQKIPPTFSASALVHSGTRGRAFVERTEVAYRVTAQWEPSNGDGDRAWVIAVIFIMHCSLNNLLGQAWDAYHFWTRKQPPIIKCDCCRAWILARNSSYFWQGNSFPMRRKHVVFYQRTLLTLTK